MQIPGKCVTLKKAGGSCAGIEIYPRKVLKTRMIYYTIHDYLKLLEEAGLVTARRLLGREDTPIVSLTYNSAETVPGTLFVCKGALFKRDYLLDAAARGAVLYISETDYHLEEIPCILVSDIRLAMPLLARKFYQIPADALHYIGITGTKGKTTTAYYVKAIFDEYMKQTGGVPTAFFTSVETYDGRERKPSRITTPESMELYRHFRNAFESGIRYVTMEVSSQALKYGRVLGIPYDVGVFLNISEDHISPVEHRDFQDYFQSKLLLFRQVKTACVSLDSPFSREILAGASSAERILTFGTTEGADIYGYGLHTEGGRICFRAKCSAFDEAFTLAMHGAFNVENALAAIAVAYSFGLPADAMKAGLARATVSGRMEEFSSRDNRIKAIVDYAHNALSFEKIFEAAEQEFPGFQLVSVFGCPGGKALNRRGDLGTAAGRRCSRIYLTADDPGPEDAMDICREIGQYVEKTGCPYECISDREEAIRKAVRDVTEPSVILVLGKGSETGQKIGQKDVSYRSDAEIIRECLQAYDDASL